MATDIALEIGSIAIVLFGLREVFRDIFHRRVTHRCPGEWITVEEIKSVVRVLIREMDYEVPRQNLRIDLARIPALPKGKFIITSVRLRQ